MLCNVISLVISAIYLIVTIIFSEKSITVFYMALYLVIPLILIWLPEGLGKWRFWWHVTTSETPDFFVKLGGWMLLLFPALFYLIIILSLKTAPP